MMGKWVDRVRDPDETWEEKQTSQYDWAVKAGLTSQSFPNIYRPKKVRRLKMHQLIRSTEVEKALRLRECLLRHGEGRSTRYNNYVGASIKLWAELCEEIAELYSDEINLSEVFSGRSVSEREDSSSYTASGTPDGLGGFYLSYWQMYVPYEKYLILNKLQTLKRMWQSRTSKEGDHLSGEERNKKITDVRVLWTSNGVAEDMAKELHLPFSVLKHLSGSFSGRKNTAKKADKPKKEESVIEVKEVVQEDVDKWYDFILNIFK